jgi:hypothetical protein
MRSVTHLAVVGTTRWFNADTLGRLTRPPLSVIPGPCLVPRLEVLKICDASIDPHFFATMIESRQLRDDIHDMAQLKEVRFEWYREPRDEDDDNTQVPIIFDAGTLDHLRSYRENGMDISIIDLEDDRRDLLGAGST